MDSCTYGDWQLALEKYFFSEKQPPFVLFIDDLTLGEISQQYFQNIGVGEATKSLQDVVRPKLVMSENDRIFSNINTLISDWKKGDLLSAPPVLPVLALSVLAATQRNSQGSYYENLARLLANKYDNIVTLENYLNLGNSYYSIMEYWKITDSWIRNKFGEDYSTIRASNHYTKIGFALSQSFMKASDQNLILSIFDGSESKSLKDIEYKLSLELTKTNGFSKIFTSSFLKENMRDAVVHACKTILISGQKSDGKTSGNHKRLQLMIDDNPWSIFLKIESDLGLDSISGADSHGREYCFTEELGSNFYLHELSKESFQLEEDLEIETNIGTFHFPTQNYTFLSKESVLGIYQETVEFSLREKYLVLVNDDGLSRINELTSLSDSIHHNGIRDAKFLGLINHHVIFDLEFCNRESLDEFTNVRGNRIFKERQSSGVELIGGLALRNSSGSRRVFLEGGEPSIQLPKSADNSNITVVINSLEQEMPSNGSIFHLRNLGLTRLGLNTIFVGKRNLSFYIHRSIESTIDVSTRHAGSIPNERVVLIGRHSIGTYALLDNGDYRAIETPPVSRIWQEIYSEEAPIFFEYVPRSDESWVAQRISKRWYLLNLNESADAWVPVGDIDLLSLWRESTKFPDKKWAWNWATQV